MAKHEPWHKPRDEDEDDKLLDWLGQKDPKYSKDRGGNGRNGGGCALLIVAGIGAATALGVLGSAAMHFLA